MLDPILRPWYDIGFSLLLKLCPVLPGIASSTPFQTPPPLGKCLAVGWIDVLIMHFSAESTNLSLDKVPSQSQAY